MTTSELSGQRLATPVIHAALLGHDYALAYLELLAEDHAFTFQDCWTRFDSQCTKPYGPSTDGIRWMAKR